MSRITTVKQEKNRFALPDVWAMLLAHRSLLCFEVGMAVWMLDRGIRWPDKQPVSYNAAVCVRETRKYSMWNVVWYLLFNPTHAPFYYLIQLMHPSII